MDPSPAHPPGDLRNWLELPRDLTASILLKLGAIEILTSAQKVCSLWRNICKDPSLWRAVDMRNLGDFDINIDYDLEKMCQHAVDRSGGELVDINIEHFGTDELLKYITESSSKLRRLRLVSCYSISDEGLSEAAGKLPLLEELYISYCSLSKESLEAVGRCCPLLKSLKFNNHGYRRPRIECDEDALAIAESMPELRHLQLFGNKLTNDGLLAVLGGCPKIESLDLRHCFNVTLTGDLGRRCADSIKHLRSPCDSTSDYEFDTDFHDSVSFADDSASEFSDIDYFSDDDGYYELSGDSDSSDFDMYENGDFFDLSDHGEFMFD